MANFNTAFTKTVQNEGGFKLTDAANDTNRYTIAGIVENYHRIWAGWAIINGGNLSSMKLTAMVKAFYKTQFWDAMKGDSIKNQSVAESVFAFGVNAGIKTSVKLAQKLAGVATDGIMKPRALKALNAVNAELFVAHFALAKIARYASIVTKDSTQSKFLLGWINLTMKGAG